jgi:multiple sugar transport system permease protein
MRKRRLARLLIYAFLSVLALTILIPFVWMISNSLKESAEIYTWPPVLKPSRVQWNNYLTALTLVPFNRFFLNSLIVTAVITISSIILDSMAGYAFAKYSFKGNNVLFYVVLATLMLPVQSIIIPVYIMLRTFGWVDTYLALIIPNISNAFGIFLMRQFIQTIPDELMEAARIDGLGEFGIYKRIILPLCKPALATLAIFQIQYNWNDFFWPLIMTNSTNMKTVQLGLVYFTGQYFTQWNLLMAVVVTALLPIIVIFIFTQRYFIEGITLSGLKG